MSGCKPWLMASLMIAVAWLPAATALVSAEAVTVVARHNAWGGACRAVVVAPVPGVAVDARENWWGTSTGPGFDARCPGTTGPVAVEPWLVDAPYARSG